MLMQGALPIRRAITDVLRSQVPATIAMFNTQYGNVIPVVPSRYEEYEAAQMNHGDGPLLAVTVTRSAEHTTTDIDSWSAMEYRPTYRVTIYTWCFTVIDEDGLVPVDARINSLELRDNLAVVVRSVILNNPALTDVNKYEINESTLEESYSDSSPVPNASGRHIAGVQHSFTVRVDEKLDRTGVNYLAGPVTLSLENIDATSLFPADPPKEGDE